MVVPASLHRFPPRGEDIASSDATQGKLIQARAFTLEYNRRD